MQVTLDVDTRAWNADVDNWLTLAYLEGVRANVEAAQVVQRRTRSLLAQYHHRPLTSTPSPPGQPPAMISGRLAASVLVQRDGDDALVGPTRWASSVNGPYGRLLELGGTQEAHNDSGEMWWFEDGYWHDEPEVTKFARPYLKPATDDAVESGDIYGVYWRRWLVAQQMATA